MRNAKGKRAAPGRPTRIKFCGMTRAEDIESALRLGVDAVGLNFWPPSPRYVSAAKLAELLPLLGRVRGRLEIVGVFVDQPLAEVRALASSARLDFVQLHGHEEEAYCRACGDLGVIKAFRVEGPATFAAAWRYAKFCARVLLDGAAGGRRGGSGETWNWEAARASGQLRAKKMILAGGLTPENVGEAIACLRPFMVDVASGIESAPGSKDEGKMRAFVAAVRAAEKSA